MSTLAGFSISWYNAIWNCSKFVNYRINYPRGIPDSSMRRHKWELGCIKIQIQVRWEVQSGSFDGAKLPSPWYCISLNGWLPLASCDLLRIKILFFDSFFHL